MDLKKRDGETEKQYLWRVGQCVLAGKCTWKEITPIINEQWRSDEEDYRDESAYRKPFQSANSYYEEVFSKMLDDDYANEIREQKRELEKERKKIATEKLEYNKWLREEARDELIAEKITDAINNLEPLDIPEFIPPVHNNKSWLLVLADAHYGVEFELKDLFGGVINAYSPEIFEKRMWELFNKIVELIADNDITELNIFELGDGIDGMLRLTSQLMKLRYGIVDGTIKYASFLANWINELSRYTRIKFQMVMDSNHNQLRLCSAPKNSFTDENMSKIMLTIIKERLADNDNVVIYENPTGLAYSMMSAYSVLGCHGEYKNMANTINDISRCYQTPIDYLITGHIHHGKTEEVGIDSEVISVRSIIGVDSYGLSLNKTSNAGASLICFEQGYGKTCEYTIKLN